MLRATLAFLAPGILSTATAQGALTTANNVGSASSLRQVAALTVSKAAMFASAAATKVAAAGQWLLNAALTANPVGLAISAVAAVAAGMVYLYRTCEPVRAAFDAVFGWIGDKIGWAWEKLKSVGKFFGLGGGEDKSKEAEQGTAKAYAASPSASALPELADLPEMPEQPELAATTPAKAQAPAQINLPGQQASQAQPSCPGLHAV